MNCHCILSDLQREIRSMKCYCTVSRAAIENPDVGNPTALCQSSNGKTSSMNCHCTVSELQWKIPICELPLHCQSCNGKTRSMNCHCTLSELQRENPIYIPPTVSELQREIPIYTCTRTHARKRAHTDTHRHTHTHTHTHTRARARPLSQSYNGKTRFLYTAPLAFRAAPGSGLHGGRPVRGARGVQHARGRCVHVRCRILQGRGQVLAPQATGRALRGQPAMRD